MTRPSYEDVARRLLEKIDTVDEVRQTKLLARYLEIVCDNSNDGLDTPDLLYFVTLVKE